jgi:hypothetical protein
MQGSWGSDGHLSGVGEPASAVGVDPGYRAVDPEALGAAAEVRSVAPGSASVRIEPPSVDPGP